ncbi:BTB domain-containing protein [Mycena sanguinolenta]|uniref:BTB domain-containing protein n=1 Tax=Mycena sanguinolenta TaxID=230812 RepID=A0A8H6Z5X6_9AGAR|nr:BTB domain-containing protein [Mycena sanguinolenta]
MPLQDDTAVALERVQDLWFPDATFILRAENKLFRVYKHILGARSPVFRDMASFPQPATPEGDTVDGIPVVRLHDGGADAEVFLRAIFDSSFFMPSPAATDFPIIIGVMRLSHKYDVSYLFRRALSHLESMYQHTLPELQDFCMGRTESHVSYFSSVDTDLITVREVSQVGALWMLPAAYYAVCEVSSKKFLASEVWSALTTDEQQTCLKSQVEFVRATVSAHNFLRSLPAQACEGECSRMVSEALTALSSWGKIDRDLDPLGPWVLHKDGDDQLCSECMRYAAAAYGKVQLEFWNSLPDILGLPGWNELKQMRRAVMEDAP